MKIVQSTFAQGAEDGLVRTAAAGQTSVRGFVGTPHGFVIVNSYWKKASKQGHTSLWMLLDGCQYWTGFNEHYALHVIVGLAHRFAAEVAQRAREEAATT